MVNKEFNLSELECKTCAVYTRAVIKEFIKKLKQNTYWVNGHSKLCEEIDKLAGDKLI